MTGMSEWLMSLFQNVLRTSLFFLFVRSIWKRSPKSHTESDVQVIFGCCNTTEHQLVATNGVNKLFLMYGFVPPVIYLLMMYMRPTTNPRTKTTIWNLNSKCTILLHLWNRAHYWHDEAFFNRTTTFASDRWTVVTEYIYTEENQ